MRFTLNGVEHDLDARTVIARTRGVQPEPVQTHGIRIGGITFPVKQAFELATGVSRAQFTSHTALRHLQSLGFAPLSPPQARRPIPLRPRRLSAHPIPSPFLHISR